MAIDVVVQRVAGLDIAKPSLVACVRVPGPRRSWVVHKRKFATTTKDLLELLAWLIEHQVTRVGMESTSGYWKPVFYVLGSCRVLAAQRGAYESGPWPQDRHG